MDFKCLKCNIEVDVEDICGIHLSKEEDYFFCHKCDRDFEPFMCDALRNAIKFFINENSNQEMR